MHNAKNKDKLSPVANSGSDLSAKPTLLNQNEGEGRSYFENYSAVGSPFDTQPAEVEENEDVFSGTGVSWLIALIINFLNILFEIVFNSIF